MKMRLFTLSICLAVPMAGFADPIPVPSGQSVEFHDVIWEQGEGKNIYRFRYIAPEIARDGGSVDFAKAEPDLQALCESSAIPALQEQGRVADRIIISLSDIPVEFGKPTPEATQFIDAFSPDNDICIWEGF